MAHYRRIDLALLFFLGLIWGSAFMFISVGLDRFSPLLFAALRFDITGLLLLGIAVARRRGPLVPRGANQWMTVAMAGILMTGAYHAFLFWGQQYTTGSIAAIIVGLSPVLTTAFSRGLLHGETVELRGLGGLLLGLLGIVLLATLKEGSLLDARGLGELAVVVAIASWALGSVLVKRAKHGMELFSFAAWQALVGAIGLHISSLALEGSGRAVWDFAGIRALLYLAVISSGIGFIIYFRLVEHVGPIRVNVVSYIAPIFATLTGIVYLNDPLELRAVVAFLLIASGLTLVIARSRAPGPAPAAPPGEMAASPDMKETGRVGP